MQAARKPNFVLDDHSSRPAVTDRLQQPTRRFRHCTLRLGAPGRRAPAACEERCRTPCLFGLAPCGVYHALRVTPQPVRSYRTFSPLPLPCGLHRKAGAVSSLLHWPSTRLEAGLPDVIRHTALRSSDFPPPANTLAAPGRQRSSGRLHLLSLPQIDGISISAYTRGVTSKELKRWLTAEGATFTPGKGSHLKVLLNGRKTVMPVHNGDLPKGTLEGIKKDLGLK